MSLQILFIAPQPFYTSRGTPIATRAVLETLAESGHQIDLLTYHKGEDVEIEGVRITRIARPMLVRKVPIGPSWQKLLCDLSLLRVARRMVREKRYDLVHGVEEASFIALHLARKHGTPFVFDMDSLMSEQMSDKGTIYRPFAGVFRRLERAAIARSLGVLAVCPALVDAARPYHPDDRVALLPDFPLFSADDQPGCADLDEVPGLKLLYVGNLEPYQGIDLLLEAVAIADTDAATLLVVGGSPEQIARYERIAGPQVERGRVRFLGPRPIENLGSLLVGADVLVSPRMEGRNTPMKIYSYLESGRPVVATRLPTHTQVLDDEIALLVEPTAREMASGITGIIESAEQRDRIGRAGQARVRAEYGPDSFRRRLRGFYDDVERRLAERGT